MKISLPVLRKLIREELKGLSTAELREYAGLSEGYRVKYIGKDGKPAQATFPNERLANMYAANLKGATVEIDGNEMPDVAVQQVAPAGLDDLRASSKAFYKQAQAGEKFAPRETPKMAAARADADAARAENEAELEAEFWMDSRAAGQSQEDAFKDLDFLRSRHVREAVRVFSGPNGAVDPIAVENAYYQLLDQQGTVTVLDVAELLGVTPNVVREMLPAHFEIQPETDEIF